MKLKPIPQAKIDTSLPTEAMSHLLMCCDAVPLNLVAATRDFYATRNGNKFDEELHNCIVALVTARRLYKHLMKL